MTMALYRATVENHRLSLIMELLIALLPAAALLVAALLVGDGCVADSRLGFRHSFAVDDGFRHGELGGFGVAGGVCCAFQRDCHWRRDVLKSGTVGDGLAVTGPAGFLLDVMRSFLERCKTRSHERCSAPRGP